MVKVVYMRGKNGHNLLKDPELDKDSSYSWIICYLYKVRIDNLVTFRVVIYGKRDTPSRRPSHNPVGH